MDILIHIDDNEKGTGSDRVYIYTYMHTYVCKYVYIQAAGSDSVYIFRNMHAYFYTHVYVYT